MNKALKNVVAAMLGVVVLVAIIGGGIALGKKYGFDITEVISEVNTSVKNDNKTNTSSSSSKPDHDEPTEDDEVLETLTFEIDHLVF